MTPEQNETRRKATRIAKLKARVDCGLSATSEIDAMIDADIMSGENPELIAARYGRSLFDVKDRCWDLGRFTPDQIWVRAIAQKEIEKAALDSDWIRARLNGRDCPAARDRGAARKGW